MRDKENESEEGAVEDDYGSGEIGGFDEISKREERRYKEKTTNADESRERESLSE